MPGPILLDPCVNSWSQVVACLGLPLSTEVLAHTVRSVAGHMMRMRIARFGQALRIAMPQKPHRYLIHPDLAIRTAGPGAFHQVRQNSVSPPAHPIALVRGGGSWPQRTDDGPQIGEA
jgi:hypothetical protein